MTRALSLIAWREGERQKVERLATAARQLAKSLPDALLDSLAEPWGAANVTTIKAWRDAVLEATEPKC